VRLWSDATRVEQLARLRELELQAGDDFAQRVWDLAHEQWRQLPDAARIDLPSPRVFGRVLGLFRTGATLKTGKLLRLELSAEEIAELLGYSKTTIEATLRWLDSGPIEYQGAQLARGLGIIHRGRRTAWAFLEGQLRRVYRTSRLVLTLVGRALLGLLPTDDEHRREQRRARATQKTPPPVATIHPLRTREQAHIEGAAADSGAGVVDHEGMTEAVGRSWLSKIMQSL
jgi:hypothetical protein